MMDINKLVLETLEENIRTLEKKIEYHKDRIAILEQGLKKAKEGYNALLSKK